MLVNTHYFGFLPMAAQFFLLIYFSIRAGFERRLFSASAIAGLLICSSLIPLFQYLLKNFGRTGTWIKKPAESFFIDMFVVQFGSLPVVLLCLFLLVLALVKLFRVQDKKDVLKVLLFCWFFGVTVAYLRSLFFTPILTLKNAMVFLPITIVLVSYGFGLVRDGFVRWTMLIFVCGVSASFVLSDPDRSQFRIESDLRSPVKKVMEEGRDLPVYANSVYSDYLQILGSSVRTKSFEELKRQLKAGSTGPCFYVIDPDADELSSYSKQLDTMVVEKNDYQQSSIALLKSRDGADCISRR
jgi:hypothetical protein